MKRSLRLGNTASRLPGRVQQQLNMYALAAGAAGVGMLALTQPSESKVIYTPAHKHIGINSTLPLDMDKDGRADFTFVDRWSTGYGWDNGALSVSAPGTANQVWGHTFGRGYASALFAGARIGQSKHFFPGERWIMARTSASFTSCLGPWGWVKRRYLGLKFLVNGKTHYGWARLNVRCENVEVTATLTGYAYETVPGKPIVTGKMADATLGQTLGGLAVGDKARRMRGSK